MADAVQPQTRKWPPLFHSPNNKLAIWGTMNEPASLSNSISLLRTKQRGSATTKTIFLCMRAQPDFLAEKFASEQSGSRALKTFKSFFCEG